MNRAPATRAAQARTMLFVPGDRPERFSKAVASGAGLVVLDLEDAVGRRAKAEARESVRTFLRSTTGVGVRVNSADSSWHDADLEMLADLQCTVMVPKAQSVDELEQVWARMNPGSAIIALVETAQGVLSAPDLARVPAVRRLAFGSFDLAAELGVSPEDRDAMTPARGALVLASAAAGIAPPVDGVTADVTNADALRSDVEYSRRLGFTGKLCIHPVQVSAAEDALRPSTVEIAWAVEVVAAWDAAAGTGVVSINGRMIDKPVVDRARRLLSERPFLGMERHG